MTNKYRIEKSTGKGLCFEVLDVLFCGLKASPDAEFDDQKCTKITAEKNVYFFEHNFQYTYP
jgi:hypothetical protein